VWYCVALAEVLMEEPNFCKEKEPTLTPKTQESGRRKKMKKKKKEKSGATAEEEEAEGDQEEFDLEALLKEAGIEGVDGDDDEGGDGEDESEEGLGGGEGGEGSDEDHPAASDGEAPEGDDDSGDTFSIKPYTTDLEYDAAHIRHTMRHTRHTLTHTQARTHARHTRGTRCGHLCFCGCAGIWKINSHSSKRGCG
jgi:hypothetical protein